VRLLLFFIHMKNLTKVSLLTYAGALLIVQNAQIAQQQQDALSLLVWVALGALHNGAANTHTQRLLLGLFVRTERRSQKIHSTDTMDFGTRYSPSAGKVTRNLHLK
jgi:hypothetical protein